MPYLVSMAGSMNLDWLFAAVGWMLASGGTALLIWALFLDRSRGRRRCPRCWYDMAGVPGLLCPECGRTVESEKRLGRTRRRWRWGAAALALGAAGAAVKRTPDYRRHGWVSLVPSCVLAYIATPTPQPGQLPPFSFVGKRLWHVSDIIPNIPIAPPPAVASKPSVAEALGDEYRRRFWGWLLSPWEGRMFIQRFLESYPSESIGDYFLGPRRWIAGSQMIIFPRSLVSPFPIGVRVSGGAWAPWDGPIPVPEGARGPTPIEFSYMYRNGAVLTIPFSATVDVRATPETLLDRLDSPALNAQVAAAMRPRLGRSHDSLALEFDDDDSRAERHSLDLGVYFDVEVRLKGHTVARGNSNLVWAVWQPRSSGMTWLRPEPGESPLWEDLEGKAEIVITGNPRAAALRYLELARLARPACWTGQIVVPVERVENLVRPAAAQESREASP